MIRPIVAPTRARQIRLLSEVTRLPLVEAAVLDHLIDEVWASGVLGQHRGSDVALYATLGECTSTATVHDRALLQQALERAGHVSAARVGEPAPVGYVFVAVSSREHQATVCIAVDGERAVTAPGEVS